MTTYVELRALWLAALLGLCSCATVKADVKDVADVCTPELAGDVTTALPLVIADVECLTSGGDCTSEQAALAVGARAVVAACALAEIHAATVIVAPAVGAAK